MKRNATLEAERNTAIGLAFVSRLPASFLAIKSVGRLISAAGIGLCLTLQTACAQAAPAQSETNAAGETIITVSSVEQLQAALQGLEGPAKILLQPGQYPTAVIRNLSAGGDVEVTSADPERPALLGGLHLRDVSGINFSNLALARQASDPRFANYLLWVVSSNNVRISGLTFRGVGDRVDPEIRAAVMLRDSHDLEFSHNSFAYFRHGLSLLDLENVTIRNNEFTNLQTDAIRGGGISNAVIANNVMGNFSPAEGDHPDGIQLWTANQDEPGRNITIRDNLVFKGDGAHVQGIFIRDNRDQLPFENVEISGNLIIGTMYHGISINGVTGGLIADNEVLPDPQQISWIKVDHGDNVMMRDNRAERYLVRFERGPVRQSGNRRTAGNYSERRERITEWVSAREGFSEYRGPLLISLMAGS